jgi:uncharacterized membrane protein YebE (DUF533 family)
MKGTANMNIQSLLNAVLKSAAPSGSSGKSDWGKYAAGGAVGLLLGSKRGRSMGGSLLKYGSVAALGAMAWKMYQDHQAQQQRPAGMPAPSPGSVPGSAPAAAPSFEALPAPVQERHSQAMLKAMIAAAKSDGHMDTRERDLVFGELTRLQADSQTRQWVEAELNRPVDPAEVASAAQGPEMAAEMYLASLLVVDDTSTMERAYLDALARELRLDAGLKTQLEAKAMAAA